jgi:hypothetical protein
MCNVYDFKYKMGIITFECLPATAEVSVAEPVCRPTPWLWPNDDCPIPIPIGAPILP